MTGHTLLTLADEITQTIERAAAAVIQIRVPGKRPTTGTVCGTDRVLAIDHTLASADRARLVAGDRTVEAEVVGRDGDSDLALLKAAGLSIAPLPVFADSLRVGEPAVIVGRDPQGGTSASFGIIGSITGPARLGRTGIERVIRIDASPFPGISGAAVVSGSGQLLGVANGALVRGMALAVPAPIALSVAAALAEHGRIRRGYLGIGTQPVRLPPAQRGDRDQSQGLLVAGVVEGSPAERSGLLIGDVLLSFDGRPLEVPDDLLDLLTGERIDRRVPVELVRGGKSTTLEVAVGERGAR